MEGYKHGDDGCSGLSIMFVVDGSICNCTNRQNQNQKEKKKKSQEFRDFSYGPGLLTSQNKRISHFVIKDAKVNNSL